MPTATPTAHVSTSPFLTTFRTHLASRTRRTSVRLEGVVKCGPSQQIWRESRRLVSISLVLISCFPVSQSANASNIFDKYMKKKKLDPLEAYVPAVILTEFQIKDLGPSPLARLVGNVEVTKIHQLGCSYFILPNAEKTLEIDEPRFDTFRSILRSGPAASLRVNIRAVAQYASDDGNGKTATNDVDECLRALEDLDYLFLQASRKDPNASIQSMKAKIEVALGALDSLLKTVPTDILNKGKAAAAAYLSPDDNIESGTLDPEIKQLESIL